MLNAGPCKSKNPFKCKNLFFTRIQLAENLFLKSLDQSYLIIASVVVSGCGILVNPSGNRPVPTNNQFFFFFFLFPRFDLQIDLINHKLLGSCSTYKL